MSADQTERFIRCDPETWVALRTLKGHDGRFLLTIDREGRDRFLGAVVEVERREPWLPESSR